jgi:hypothetical protein
MREMERCSGLLPYSRPEYALGTEIAPSAMLGTVSASCVERCETLQFALYCTVCDVAHGQNTVQGCYAAGQSRLTVPL